MKPVSYLPEAEDEILSARAASPRPGDFDTELFEALDLLASGTVTGGSTRVKNWRQWILPRLPYSLVYWDGVGVLVVAFAHHSRRPGYWKRRVAP